MRGSLLKENLQITTRKQERNARTRCGKGGARGKAGSPGLLVPKVTPNQVQPFKGLFGWSRSPITIHLFLSVGSYCPSWWGLLFHSPVSLFFKHETHSRLCLFCWLLLWGANCEPLWANPLRSLWHWDLFKDLTSPYLIQVTRKGSELPQDHKTKAACCYPSPSVLQAVPEAPVSWLVPVTCRTLLVTRWWASSRMWQCVLSLVLQGLYTGHGVACLSRLSIPMLEVLMAGYTETKNQILYSHSHTRKYIYELI